MATALMVMGYEKGFKFAEKHGILAYFIAGSPRGKRQEGLFVQKASTQLKLLLGEYFN